jgi:NAD-dependent dihydropyrimidine dehydrogenase PreA subunit
MSQPSTHPTVERVRRRSQAEPPQAPLDADWLRALCLDAGAEDVGFVSIDRPEIAGEKPHILAAFPKTRTLISIVTRLHREAVRSPARSVGNLEFHRNYHEINAVAHRIAAALERKGIPALNPAAGFPMEMDRFPGRIWVVSHKPVAVAAGLGRIGIHRSVIHPVFGSFVNLATVLVAAEVTRETAPIDYNPCLSCKLCVAACPVGALEPDGYFNFSACLTHNYREFMGGFAAWVEDIADAKDSADLRKTRTVAEQASMWQSLSFGANYKAAYCIAACPAGEDVIGPYLADKSGFVRDVVKPLQAKAEPVYVVPGSDAEEHVRKRYPSKTIRRVRNGVRPQNIAGLLMGMALSFQRNQARTLDAVYHFRFTGAEQRDATITIRKRSLAIQDGLVGRADLVVRADSQAWLQFVRKERGLLSLLLSRKLRLKGSPKLLAAFGKCFP